jgi:hypothetical protein
MQKFEIVLEVILKQRKMHKVVRLPNAQTVLLFTRGLITTRNHVMTSTDYTGSE